MRDLQMNPAHDVDHLIRSLIPCFLEAAGLKREASVMRKLPSILDGRGAVGLSRKFLSSLERSTSARVVPWSRTVGEVAFWAEGAVVSATEGNNDDCLACVWFVKREMDEIWSQFLEH